MSKEIEKGKVTVSIEERDLVSDFMYGMKGIFPSLVTWNDLMPVVEKICKTDSKYRFDLDICVDLSEVRFYEEITQKHDTGRDFEMVANTVKVDNPIEATWSAVVQFINWYKTNSKTSQ